MFKCIAKYLREVAANMSERSMMAQGIYKDFVEVMGDPKKLPTYITKHAESVKKMCNPEIISDVKKYVMDHGVTMQDQLLKEHVMNLQALKKAFDTLDIKNLQTYKDALDKRVKVYSQIKDETLMKVPELVG